MSEDVRALAARLLAASPYAMPIEEAIAQAASRRRQWLAIDPPPQTDFAAAEPIPCDDPVHDPAGFAHAFWQRRRSQTPKGPPGRPPKGDLSSEHDRFRVLDGGKQPHGDNDP